LRSKHAAIVYLVRPRVSCPVRRKRQREDPDVRNPHLGFEPARRLVETTDDCDAAVVDVKGRVTPELRDDGTGPRPLGGERAFLVRNVAGDDAVIIDGERGAVLR
jgi:hypothetical protein